MGAGALTGATEKEVAEMEAAFEGSRHDDHDIPFDRAYCLAKIGKQPDEYDGPQRYCKNRASRVTEEEWAERYDDEYDEWDVRSFCHTCRFHGRRIDGHPETLEPHTAAITHGMRAEDKHLRMDFTDAEQALYDGIVEQWPEVYDWPPESEDPARYLILKKVATNVVRSHRAEDYLDDEGEIHMKSIYEDGVEVGQEPEENPISGEYRLLVREIVSMLKELGVTPKEQAAQNVSEKSANGLAAIGDAVNDAVVGSDEEYDPDQFEDGDTT